LRLFSFGGYGLALAALALVVFGAIECPPSKRANHLRYITLDYSFTLEMKALCFTPPTFRSAIKACDTAVMVGITTSLRT